MNNSFAINCIVHKGYCYQNIFSETNNSSNTGSTGPTGPAQQYSILGSPTTVTGGTGPGYIYTTSSTTLNTFGGNTINRTLVSNIMIYVPDRMQWSSAGSTEFFSIS